MFAVKLFIAGLLLHTYCTSDEGHAKCVTRTLKLLTNGITCFDSILIKKLYLGCADLTMKGE